MKTADALPWLTRTGWTSRFRRYWLLVRLLLLQIRLRHKLLVVLRAAGMGDVIATLPACQQLALRNPDRVLVFVSHASFEPILKMAGFPIHFVPDVQALLPDLGRHVLRSHRLVCPDDFFRPPKENFIVDFAASCGVVLSPEERPVLHVPEEILRAVGDQAAALAAGRPLITFHAGPTDKVRELPEQIWTELIALLLQTNAFVVQLGTTRHTRWGQKSAAGVPGAYSLLDRLSLTETAAWLSHSSLFVGIDSGVLQMAVAVNCPAVALTGPTDMRFRFPLHSRAISLRTESLPCIGCHHRVPRLHWDTGCPYDIACMKQIEAKTVATTVADLLRERLPPAR